MAIYLKNNKYQCPVSGLFHFYINLKPIKQEKSRSVNALCRAYSISTVTCDVKKFGIRGVNALCRAYSISTDFREQYQLFDKRCQCPVSGLFHFYQSFIDTNAELNGCVNALCRAYSIST